MFEVGQRVKVDRYSAFGSEFPTGVLVGEIIEVTAEAITVRGNSETLIVPLADSDDVEVIN